LELLQSAAGCRQLLQDDDTSPRPGQKGAGEEAAEAATDDVDWLR
jgi:hypothetical protein